MKTSTDKIVCRCGHYHDGDVCDDCACPIYNAATGDKVGAVHTPTPWEIYEGGAIGHGKNYGIKGVAEAHLWPDDAAFIVKACNAHDDLVAIAREALAVVEHGGGSFAMGEKGKNYGIEDRIKAALAKAEGGAR
jgi:hypothetical protein